MNKNRKLAYLALIINAIIWGAALPIVKPSLSYVTPYQYLFYRYLFAVPFSILPLIYLFRKIKPSLKTILTIVGMELIAVTGALSFLYEGLKRTTSIEATLIANTAPVFIIIGGVLFLKEKEERHELFGLILAIIGMILLTFEPVISGRNNFQSFSLTGNLLVLGQNALWATYLLLAKKYYKKISKLLIGFTSLWIGLISFFLLTLITSPESSFNIFIQTNIENISIPSVFLASIYMAILGSIVANTAYVFGNNLIEASEASLFTYLQPLIAIPIATLWLHEPINSIIILALILTTSGVIVAERRKTKLKKT
jgi:drug/metabolite transporter (DMT)-like permease